ncbi:MAG: lipid-A-disaccharide synthase [Pseudomonadota bacterium]
MTGTHNPLKLAVIAGEPSGDLLGAELIAALKARLDGRKIELVGVGGEAMAGQGLKSLFDYHDLSIVGISAVVAQLPRLLSHIRTATRAIVDARPDLLVVIDSPAFSHRVARKVRKRLPNLPVINYVCPSVWAWRPHRAKQMTAYIDHILSILPFEPKVVADLGGPPLTYVGHRLASDPALLKATENQKSRQLSKPKPDELVSEAPLCLLLPGSRRGELKRLLPDFSKVVEILAARTPGIRFQIATLPRLESTIRPIVSDWSVPVAITTDSQDKWTALSEADVALAASGTVLLELAIAGVPCVSIYRLDAMTKPFEHLVTTWTAALPNLVVDHPVINEYVNENIRPGLIARRLERLLHGSAERQTMLAEFENVRAAMQTEQPPAELAAEVVSDLLQKSGHR